MTSQTVDSLRTPMIALRRQGRTYEFLSRAELYLQIRPGDAGVRTAAAGAYLKLGLMVPAERLLTASAMTGHPGLAAWRRRLQPGGGRVIDWNERALLFDQNLAAMLRAAELRPGGSTARRVQDETLNLLRREWNIERERFEAFQDVNNLVHLSLRLPDGSWTWLPYLGDLRAVAAVQPLPEDLSGPFPGPYLFEGVEQPWYLRRVYDASRNTFLTYSCALYLVEPDAASLAAILHLHDWTDLLADPRVLVMVGPEWMSRLREWWGSTPDLPLPTQILTLRSPGRGSVGSVEVVKTVALERQSREARLAGPLKARYANRDAHYWSRRFQQALTATGPPLRILGAVSMHTTFLQHSMGDAKRALEQLGHRCEVLKERASHEVISPETYAEAMNRLDPDLFFSIDHVRPEFGTLVPANLPILTWDQDQLPQVFTRENLRRIAVHDFLAGCSKNVFVRTGCDPRQFLQTHVPTSEERFDGSELTDADLAPYRCDVSYVSHASQTPLAFHEEERAGLEHPSLVRFLDVLFELVPAFLSQHQTMHGPVPLMLLDEASKRTGIRITDHQVRERLLSWYLWRLGDRMFRHEALTWVADWATRTGRTFRIFGNGWDRHPTLSPFAAGPIENGRPLVCLHRASTINLQLMPAGFIHQRALDGLAAGGFFLARRVPHDLRGRTLRKLLDRIDELHVEETDELLNHPDPDLRSWLRAYVGVECRSHAFTQNDLLPNLRIQGELIFPDEVFDRFAEVTFSSAAEFESVAERWLTDDVGRRALARAMRSAVLSRFGYRATMDLMIRRMAEYLSQVGGSGTEVARTNQGLGSQFVSTGRVAAWV